MRFELKHCKVCNQMTNHRLIEGGNFRSYHCCKHERDCGGGKAKTITNKDNILNRGEILQLINLILHKKAILYSELAKDFDYIWTIQSLHKLEKKLSMAKCLGGGKS